VADRLAIWLRGAPVAELTRTRAGELTVTYDPHLVATHGTGALCLSVALPLTTKPYTGRTAKRWLEGLLPEGESRTALEEAFGVDRGDTFGLLAAIGRDCAGAVSFLPPGEEPSSGALEAITDDDLAAIIDALPDHPLGAEPDVPVSLAGLQQKLLLAHTDDGWARPRRGAPSTHILKPDPVSTPGLVAAEAYSMRAAALAGLDVAKVDLIDVAGRPVLVVERYDRHRDGNSVVRLHQEDGCQALGLEPGGLAKYERKNGDPTYDQLASVLSNHALDARTELRRLAAAMTCNVALQNVDAHARNHSFFIEGDTVSFAPLYDVAPAVEFTKLRTAALRVGGESRIERISAVHLILEARSWGLAKDTAEQVVIETLSALFDAMPDAAAGLPIAAATAKRTRSHVRDLLRHWRQR